LNILSTLDTATTFQYVYQILYFENRIYSKLDDTEKLYDLASLEINSRSRK